MAGDTEERRQEMNLERLKFRAKSGDEWLYGIPHKTPLGNWMMRDKQEAGRYVDPDTIGQYTGLKDKEGKEIYEGDIVCYKEANDEINTSAVRFVDASFSPITEICWMGDGECEVIGNIFDNKNLLEQ